MDNIQEIIDTISNLQKYEEELYQKLISNTKNIAIGSTQLSQSELNDIVSQINDLSETRTNLYNAVAQILGSEVVSEINHNQNIRQQTVVLHILEDELNKAKKTLSQNKNNALNQLKMVEISSYYVDRYNGQKILAQIICVCAVFMILISLGIKNTTNTILLSIFYLLFIVCILVILYYCYDFYVRTPNNFNEYNWWDIPTPSYSSSTMDTSGNVTDTSGNTPFSCTNGSCCATGTIWSDTGCISLS